MELTLAMGVSLVLLVGSFKVWTWVARTIVERQRAYQCSRHFAGGNDKGAPDVLPYQGHDWAGFLGYYQPRTLDVFGEVADTGGFLDWALKSQGSGPGKCH